MKKGLALLRRPGKFLEGTSETLVLRLRRFPRADRPCQAVVVEAVVVVPQRQAELDAAAQDLDLLLRASGRVGALEVRLLIVGQPVFVVAVLQDGFKHVLAAFHSKLQSSQYAQPGLRGGGADVRWRNTRSNDARQARRTGQGLVASKLSSGGEPSRDLLCGSGDQP